MNTQNKIVIYLKQLDNFPVTLTIPEDGDKVAQIEWKNSDEYSQEEIQEQIEKFLNDIVEEYDSIDIFDDSDEYDDFEEVC